MTPVDGASQRSGLFIAFEGPEGAGKTLHLRLLAQRLRASGRQVVETREPGGTPLADRLRTVVLDPALGEIDGSTEALILAAARADHVAHVIQPALQAGQVVLTDRYIDSTYAYQGYGSGVDLAWLDTITTYATGGLLPTLTILLDLDPAIGLARKRQDAQATGAALSRIDQRPLDYHRRVRQGFRQRAAVQPSRWLVLDATQPVERTRSRIWEQIVPLLRPTPGDPHSDDPEAPHSGAGPTARNDPTRCQKPQ